MHGDQSVEHQKRRLTCADFTTNQIEEPFEAFLFEDLECAEKRELLRDQVFLIELEPAHVCDHASVVLVKQRHIQRALSVRGLVEADLISKDRLAGTGSALNDVNSTCEYATLQYIIEAQYPCRDAI